MQELRDEGVAEHMREHEEMSEDKFEQLREQKLANVKTALDVHVTRCYDTPLALSMRTFGTVRRTRECYHYLAFAATRGALMNNGSVSSPDQRDRTILPAPESPFRGKIETAMADSTQDWPQALRALDGAPNVLMIIGDDIGFGTPSAFGGPVNTPTFDRIAQQGLCYVNFHTTAVCAASRAAFLTGRNAHSVGFGTIPDAPAGFPGYDCFLP